MKQHAHILHRAWPIDWVGGRGSSHFSLGGQGTLIVHACFALLCDDFVLN